MVGRARGGAGGIVYSSKEKDKEEKTLITVVSLMGDRFAKMYKNKANSAVVKKHITLQTALPRDITKKIARRNTVREEKRINNAVEGEKIAQHKRQTCNISSIRGF